MSDSRIRRGGFLERFRTGTLTAQRSPECVVAEKQAKALMWWPMVRVRWQAFNRGNPGPKARRYNHLFRTFGQTTPRSADIVTAAAAMAANGTR
jgi:hypothetical protein